MAKTDSLRGTLHLLVLKVLLRSHHPLTGYAISQTLMMETGRKLKVRNSSLYPALRKMKKAGWISARKAPNRRPGWVWEMTEEGRAQFSVMEREWREFRSAVDLFLRRIDTRNGMKWR